MDDMEEDKINELEKNEDDMGNLDENVSDNRNEPMLDDPKTEDLKLSDELELDTQENDEVGDDSGDAIDDETSEKSADDVDGDNDKDEGDHSIYTVQVMIVVIVINSVAGMYPLSGNFTSKLKKFVLFLQQSLSNY